MRPIDFEDARDQYGSIEFEDWLRRSTYAALRREKKIKEEKQRRFDRHPRTRISRWLQSLAEKIALDNPEVEMEDNKYYCPCCDWFFEPSEVEEQTDGISDTVCPDCNVPLQQEGD